jgi:hypothetical protein
MGTSASEEKMTNSTRQKIEGDLHDTKGTAKEGNYIPAVPKSASLKMA